MYPDESFARFISDHFVPVRVHVKQHEEWRRLSGRYGVQWTPTLLVISPDGEERYRVEGFEPASELGPHLMLGLAHSAFARHDFPEAEKIYREIADQMPDSEAAPEALYWAGVSRYKETNDASALEETTRAFHDRFQGTIWAHKASVWEHEKAA